MGSSHDIKILSLTYKWKSESLVAKILKSLLDTILSQESIRSFTAIDFFDFEFFPVKGETPECSLALTLTCWHL